MRSSWQATWADVKQVGWVVLLLWAFIAALGAMSREYFGPHTLAVSLGLAGLVTIVFTGTVAANILVSFAADLVQWARRARGRLTKR